MIIDIGTNQNDCRGKRAELNIYDDTNITFNMEYTINASHKDQDGVTVIDDFKIKSISVDIKE